MPEDRCTAYHTYTLIDFTATIRKWSTMTRHRNKSHVKSQGRWHWILVRFWQVKLLTLYMGLVSMAGHCDSLLSGSHLWQLKLNKWFFQPEEYRSRGCASPLACLSPVQDFGTLLRPSCQGRLSIGYTLLKNYFPVPKSNNHLSASVKARGV